MQCGQEEKLTVDCELDQGLDWCRCRIIGRGTFIDGVVIGRRRDNRQFGTDDAFPGFGSGRQHTVSCLSEIIFYPFFAHGQGHVISRSHDFKVTSITSI